MHIKCMKAKWKSVTGSITCVLTYLSAMSTTPQSNDGSSAEHSWDI